MTDPDHRSSHDAAHDPRNADIRIWVNGALVPRAQAMVSVYDAGFLMGDGIWEGLRLYHGRWAFLDLHLSRLFEGLRAVDIAPPMSAAAMVAALDATATANGMTTDAHARLMVTRGVKLRPFQDPRLNRAGPTVVIIMEHSVAAGHDRAGVRLATVPVVRGMPTSQDPKLNSHSKLNCILACIAAQRAGADEALMLDPQGFVSTTNGCNFFCVRTGWDGTPELWTSTGDYCLNGITRQAVIALARSDGLTVREKNFSLTEAYAATEAFLTGTFGAQTPVASIDGRMIGDGGAGPVTRRLRDLYKARVGA